MKFAAGHLRKVMKEGRWSQSELARRSGVSQAVISRLCREVRTNPGIETVNSLAETLGIDPFELLEKEEEESGLATAGAA